MTRNNRPPTETVRAISEINLTNGGYSLIPWSWYEYVTITKKNKHVTEIQYPDLLWLSILSHIVFWYTPTITVDEATQKPNPPQRKFGADKLQCGYQELADRFGASKTQVKQAVARLVEAGLITTELRTVRVKGQVLNNVMFVEPVPERVASISLSINREDPYT